MGKIKLLDEEIAHLIAAGEVVERPASVAKELLENAIDANAKAITIEIKNGGITFLSVRDDGCGIEREDVKNALLRHATSKLRDKEGLYAIETLGFRGEALSAIASVSRVEIITCAENEDVGTYAAFEGGKNTVFQDAGCPTGTTIIVRDLFFNTPARMKFMKQDKTEGNHIEDLVERMALSKPHIAFRLIKDGKVSIATTGSGKLSDAIYNVYGREFYTNLMTIDYTFEGVRAWGYIVTPVFSRANRNMQNFYVNGRYIKSKTLMFAMEESYKDTLMTKRYPACVVNVELDYSQCDINVHPAKTEVKFAREKSVYNALFYACKNALQNDDNKARLENKNTKSIYVELPESAPTAVTLRRHERVNEPIDTAKNQQYMEFLGSFKNEEQPKKEQHMEFLGSFENELQPKKEQNNGELDRETLARDREILERGRAQRESFIDKLYANSEPLREDITLKSPVVAYQGSKNIDVYTPETTSQPLKNEGEIPPDYKIIGEVFRTYIIVEKGNKIYFIDKHAAHERIIYNELKSAKKDTRGQMLLVPQTLIVTRGEFDIVMKSVEVFKELGIEMEEFGDKTILVRSLPISLDDSDARSVVEEIIEKLGENKKEIGIEKLDKMLHMVACKRAIKAKSKNNYMEISALVNCVFNMENVKYCPHGRPVLIEMSKYDLEKNFGRIV